MYQFLWIFFLYAFLGWCSEVSYAALKDGTFVNRGFLNGPVCPIYGFGVVIVVACLMPLKDNTLVLFAGSVLLTSALEWITGFVLEKLFHTRWWDYSTQPFNLGGYVCLRFSILWGLACLMVVDIIHPSIMALVSLIPHTLGVVLLCLFSTGMAVDVVATVNAIVKLNHRLRQIDELAGHIRAASDELGESLAGRVLELSERGENAKEELSEWRESFSRRSENAKQSARESFSQWKQSLAQRGQSTREGLEQLRRHLDELVLARRATERRLMRAFPDMRSQRYKEALEHLRRRLEERK